MSEPRFVLVHGFGGATTGRVAERIPERRPAEKIVEAGRD
jgi:hypothetical protein